MENHRQRISEAFASALVELFLESKNQNQWIDNLVFLRSLLHMEKNIIEFCSNLSVSDIEKKQIIDIIFPNSEADFIHWLYYIIDRKQFSNIRLIIRYGLKYLYEKLGIVEGTVFTTNKITSKLHKFLEMKLSNYFEKKVILLNRIKPELIAGYEIVVGENKFSNNLNLWLENFASEVKKDKYGNK